MFWHFNVLSCTKTFSQTNHLQHLHLIQEKRQNIILHVKHFHGLSKYTLKASETFFCYDSLSLQECFLIEFVFILKNKMFSNIKGLSSFPDNWEMWKVTSMNKTIFEISSSRTYFWLYHYSTKVIQNYFVSYWKMIHFILTHFITALINFDMKDIQR